MGEAVWPHMLNKKQLLIVDSFDVFTELIFVNNYNDYYI